MERIEVIVTSSALEKTLIALHDAKATDISINVELGSFVIGFTPSICNTESYKGPHAPVLDPEDDRLNPVVKSMLRKAEGI